MTDKDKAEWVECTKQIASIEAHIKEIKARCQHENKVDRRYIDYDRTCYEVRCPDCGKILFDGNPFEYRKYLEEQDGKL